MEQNKKKYVTYGNCCPGTPGAKKDITTCNFMLAPMTDRFVDVILEGLKKVDTSRVWTKTDRMGTTYRGRRDDVIDAVEACFIHAWQRDVHMTMEMTLTRGCPGDSDCDFKLSDLTGKANAAGIRDIHFLADCRWSLYPLGTNQYMKGIADVVNYSIDLGLYRETGHAGTILRGDVQDLFAYFRWVFQWCEQKFSHFVMEISWSVNSPTPEE